jgi:hypothetical protein
MTRSAVTIVLCAALGACSTVKIGPGDSSTITYKGDPSVGKDLADRACRRGGQQGADVLSVENTDASLPPGTGKQIITFRCSAVERERK